MEWTAEVDFMSVYVGVGGEGGVVGGDLVSDVGVGGEGGVVGVTWCRNHLNSLEAAIKD